MADLLETLTHELGETYTFERELHGGAMSRLFVAYDKVLGRRIAVKVLSREIAAEIKTERFRLEIQLVARLQHPHIVPLLQSGEVQGILYYTMPFIDGESLRSRLDREGALPFPEALRILRHVASAISYAHRNGVVHRDIKPDNVLLTDEFALVADFGVARALSASAEQSDSRLTSSGIALGTPTYMAPEQALADPEIDHRADIYAFGVLAYEVLTGAPPFKGKSAQATLAAHVVQPPDPIDSRKPGIPPAVGSMIMKCLEKKAADRPQTASDLIPVFDSASASTSQPVPTLTGSNAIAPPKKKFLPWAFAVAGLVIAIAAAWSAVGRMRGENSADDFTSVAVLPLVNVSGNKSDEYFSDGMTDELSNALARLPGVKVASRTSAYSFKGKSANVEDIGRALNVTTVLEGTVKRAGNKLRITAQLTSVRDGLSLWQDTYERDSGEVFAIQDDVARAIANALQVKLGAQNIASESRGTTNRTAYDNYLRGTYFLNARGAENLRLAVAYFDSATRQDPTFARAYAASANALALLPEYTDTPPANVSQLARNAAQKALSIDPSSAEALTSLGLVEVHDWNYSAADTVYRRALALDPNNRTANQWYGELLFHTGRFDSSVVMMRRAVALDPLAPINGAALGYALILDGKYDEAIAELKKGIQVAPNLGIMHSELGEAYMMKGQMSAAITEIETAARLDPELALRKAFLSYVYGRAGQTPKAQAILAELEKRRAAGERTDVALAVAYLGARNFDKAFEMLDNAVKVHDISIGTGWTLLGDRIWDPLRSDPRFTHILQRTNLLQYAPGNRAR